MFTKKLLNLLSKASLLLVLAIAFTACSGNDEETTDVETEEPIKIGAILPLTGDGAAYGVPMQAIAQVAVEDINANGGVNGRMLEFIWEDGKCNGQDAAAAAEKLINVDKVEVIYGGFCSSETLGAAPKAEAAGVVMLSPGSSSPDVTNAGDYIFRNYPSDTAQGEILAQLATELGFQKVGVLTEENDYTIGLEESFKSTFEEGTGVVVTESFLPTDTDFKAQITKMKGEGVDAIFVNPQTPAKADLLFKQLNEQGLGDIQLLGNDVVLGSTDILANYQDFVEGMLGAETTFNTDHPGYTKLVNGYKAKTGEAEVPFMTYGATSYDAIHLLAEGIGAVGYDGAKLKDWLYSVNGWEGVAGTLTIDQNGDPEAGHKPRMVQGGVTVPYMNEEAETTEEETTEDTETPPSLETE